MIGCQLHLQSFGHNLTHNYSSFGSNNMVGFLSQKNNIVGFLTLIYRAP